MHQNEQVSPATTRHAEPDQACADAVDLARSAAEADARPGEVGPHVGIEVEGDRIVMHLFACLNPGYVGWRWAVTVTRASRSKVVTVSESVLLPGPDALLAPAWVPWTERVRPGDLKAGDLMPARADDERLVPYIAVAGDAGLLDWDEGNAWALATGMGVGDPITGPRPVPPLEPEGDQRAADADAAGAASAGQGGPEGRTARRVGRSRTRQVRAIRPARVLSAVGRDEAATRWYASEPGPDSPLAKAAPASCQTCGFMIRLSGPLGRMFGVCANELAPDDGKVVSADHGCGAHSDGPIVVSATDDTAPAIDELGYDMLDSAASLPESVLETLDHELL
jgi:hypothetical protein